MKIGEFILKDVDIVLNEGRNTKKVNSLWWLHT